jgi:geranylgeranyl reductase family protein
VSDRWDVAVIGSGPAGATAALLLARGGARVALLEREPLPRYKTCGGGLVYRATRLAPLDLSPVVERQFADASLYLHDTGQRFTSHRSFPIVSMTMRDRLDQFLANAAAAAGAELRAPCRVRSGHVSDAGVELDTDGGRLTARIVIAADGALGTTAKWAGWSDGDPRHLAPALEYEVRVDDATMARLGAELRFDVGPVPWGYAWVFPKARGLSIGVFSTRRGAHDLRRYVEAYLELIGLTQPVAMERHGYVIPISPRRELARGPVLLVGDAAGVADPVTAEGISNAIASGRMAADAILLHGGDPTRVGRAYGDALGRELLPELARARRSAALLYDWRRLRNLFFRRMGQFVVEGVTGVFTGERPYRGAVRGAVRHFVRGLV